MSPRLKEAPASDSAAARKAGVPWDRIGEAVGTSGGAARQNYRLVAGKGRPVTRAH